MYRYWDEYRCGSRDGNIHQNLKIRRFIREHLFGPRVVNIELSKSIEIFDLKIIEAMHTVALWAKGLGTFVCFSQKLVGDLIDGDHKWWQRAEYQPKVTNTAISVPVH